MSDVRITIVVSDWNGEITAALLEACRHTLVNSGVSEKKISVVHVPGSFEIPFAARMIIRNKKRDAIICLGCVIRGETPHFEFISRAVAHAIMQLNLEWEVPVIFGVLTTDDLPQAQQRAGQGAANKGTEAALAALRMIELKRRHEKH